MGRVAVALTIVAAAVVGLTALWAPARAPRPPGLEGPCQLVVEAVETGRWVDLSTTAGPLRVPRRGTVRSSAALTAPLAPDELRFKTGALRLDLPWPFGELTVARWREIGAQVEEERVEPYSLPWLLAPVGATFTLRAEHREAALSCRGELAVTVDGGPLEGALRPAGAALVVGGAVGVGAAGRPRRRRPDPWRGSVERPGQVPSPVPRLHGLPPPAGRAGTATAAGTAYGLGVALVVLTSGAVAFESPLMTALPLAGAVAGLALGWVAPGSPGGGTAPSPVEPPELAVIPLGDDGAAPPPPRRTVPGAIRAGAAAAPYPVGP